MLSATENNWSLIAVSNDPLIMQACDKVIVLDKGRIVGDGTFKDLQEQNMLAEFID